MKRLCFLVFLIASKAVAQPQAPLWKSKYDSAQLYWKDNISHSIVLLKQAERDASNDLGVYDDNYLTILNDLGLANGEAHDYKSAEKYLRRSVAIQQEIYEPKDARIIRARCNLASVLLKSGETKKAKSIYKDILLTKDNEENAGLQLLAAQNLTEIFEFEEQFDSALFIVNKILMQNEDTGSGDEFLLAKARILRKNKRYDEATRILTSLDKDVDARPSGQVILDAVHSEEGIIDIDRGLYINAEKNLISVYRKLKKDPATDQNLLTTVTNELGYIYEKIGVWDKALAYYNESLAICVRSYGFRSLNCVIMQNNVAGIYLKQGRIKEAIAAYEQFIGTLKDVSEKNYKPYLTAVTNLASAYRQDGQYGKSLQSLEDVYAILLGKNEIHSELAATVMNNMAVTYTMMGNFEKATPYFENVLAVKQGLYGTDSPVLLDVINNLAISTWATSKYDRSIPLFERSISLASKEIKYIFPNLTETEQVAFYRQQQQNFERFNTLAVQSLTQRPEVLVYMFNNQLMLKSLAFFTNKKRNAQISSRGDKSLEHLSDLLDVKAVQLGHCYQLTTAELQTLKISIPRLEKEVDSLQKIVRHGLHTDGKEDIATDWADVRSALKNDEALIEIIRFRKYDMLSERSNNTMKKIGFGFTDSVYYAALITTAEDVNAPELVLLKNGNYLETRFYNYYRNTLEYDVDDSLSYLMYWKPFEKGLTGKHKIFISSDGVYHQINLNAIRDHSGSFIIEKYYLNPVMNASQVVHRLSSRRIDFSDIVLFGDPDFTSVASSHLSEGVRQSFNFDALPGSLQEVDGIMNILKILPTRKNIFLRQAANEINLRNLHSPSVLHIATHGFFSSRMVYLNDQVRNDYLFHSGIILTPMDKGGADGDATLENDGIVTAYDVINMDLANTDLVVLSACETGLGKIEIGEGVFGLQRSFLQAGANDVLVSLWKVEDKMTRDLMIRFYFYLNQRQSTRDSFRSAQLDLLKKEKNPRQWGGFVMISSN